MENKSLIDEIIKKIPVVKDIKSMFVKCLRPIIDKIEFQYSYWYVRNKYKTTVNKIMPELEGKKSNYIWMLWFQGIDNAPQVVQTCISSIRYHLGKNNNIIILSDDNLDEYVTLPPHINKKREEGKIPIQQYSDIIRLYLLIKYGGAWIDATLLCTGSDFYNNVVIKQSFFSFKSDMFDGGFSTWFIYSDSNNTILKKMYELLIEYWNNDDNLINYYLTDIAFLIISKKYPNNAWFTIPKYGTNPAHLLQQEILNKYDEKIFDEIKSSSDFHKLNWRSESSDPESVFNKLVTLYR